MFNGYYWSTRQNKICLLHLVGVYTYFVAEEIDITQDLDGGDAKAAALIIEQAQRMYRVEADIVRLKEELKNAEETHRKLSTETLPMLMELNKTNGFPLNNGYTLVLEPAFRANIPAESTIEKADDDERPMLEKRRNDGLQWLMANKAADIIKTEVKVILGRGDSALAKAVVTALRGFKWNSQPVKLDVEQKQQVHAGTLSKLLREKRDQGVEIPMDTFAVFDGKEAKIKSPKKGKESK